MAIEFDELSGIERFDEWLETGMHETETDVVGHGLLLAQTNASVTRLREEMGEPFAADEVLAEVERWLAMRPQPQDPPARMQAPSDDGLDEQLFEVSDEVAERLIDTFNRGEHQD